MFLRKELKMLLLNRHHQLFHQLPNYDNRLHLHRRQMWFHRHRRLQRQDIQQ
jgi:hypothetical protein